MKRFLGIVLCFVMAVSVLAGCGKADGTVSKKSSKGTILDNVRAASFEPYDYDMLMQFKEYVADKKLEVMKEREDELLTTTADNFLGYKAYYEYNSDELYIKLTFESAEEYEQANTDIKAYVEKKNDAKYSESKFSDFFKMFSQDSEAGKKWKGLIGCTKYIEQDGKSKFEFVSAYDYDLEREWTDGHDFMRGSYKKGIVIILHSLLCDTDSSYRDLQVGYVFGLAEATPALVEGSPEYDEMMERHRIWEEKEARWKELLDSIVYGTPVSELKGTEAGPQQTGDADSDNVHEYMSNNFNGRYPDIKAKLKDRGYDADNLQCSLIWSDFNKNPRLIFENKDGGVNSLVFSWQDVDYVDYFEYEEAYSAGDCEYGSVNEAYDGYVNDMRIPHVYETWTFAKPAFEEYFARYYSDDDLLAYMYKVVSASTVLGEDGFTVAVYDTRYDNDAIFGIMWNWNDGTVSDARECRYIFKPSDFEYKTLQEAFDGYCREYW